MGAYPFLAVGLGAALGAWLRWGLGMLLNPLFPTLPLGTLAANLMGGFLMGVAMELFSHHGAVPVALRLGVATGFLGGFTTFSTFSAEVVTHLSRHQPVWAVVTVATHLVGSITLTILGIYITRWLLRGGAL